MRVPMRASALLILFLVLSAVTSLPAAAAQRLVFFGDSLSDPGNYYLAFGQISTAPFAPLPDAPYDIGPGHHFSDGRTWAERLAFGLDSAESGMPALAHPGEFTNYAVGRARARPDAVTFSAYDLGTQVAMYLGDFHGHADGSATFVIWIGANDLDDALGALSADPTGATTAQIVQGAIEAVAGNIQLLWASGARTFLIPNLPDLGETPAVRALGPAAIGAASQLTSAYNGALGQALSQLKGLPGIHIVPFDVDALLNQVISHPQDFALTDVTDACLTFFTTVNPVCSHPRSYLFWDGVHPTVSGHTILALGAQRALVCDAHPGLPGCR